VIWPGGSVAQW